MAETVTIDITTLTLGEVAEVEMASGRALKELLKSRTALLIVALFVQQLRNSGQPPSWNDLSSRRLLDVSSLTSPLQQAEIAEK